MSRIAVLAALPVAALIACDGAPAAPDAALADAPVTPGDARTDAPADPDAAVCPAAVDVAADAPVAVTSGPLACRSAYVAPLPGATDGAIVYGDDDGATEDGTPTTWVARARGDGTIDREGSVRGERCTALLALDGDRVLTARRAAPLPVLHARLLPSDFATHSSQGIALPTPSGLASVTALQRIPGGVLVTGRTAADELGPGVPAMWQLDAAWSWSPASRTGTRWRSRASTTRASTASAARRASIRRSGPTGTRAPSSASAASPPPRASRRCGTGACSASSRRSAATG